MGLNLVMERQVMDSTNRVCRAMARFGTAFWVGAALLFVLTSVAEQTSSQFAPFIRQQLAMVRFPWFYRVGGVVIAITACSSLGIANKGRWGQVASAAIWLAAILMIIDCLFVYRPLVEQLRQTVLPASQRFENLHGVSEGLNAVEFLLMTAAALILQWLPEGIGLSAPAPIAPDEINNGPSTIR